MNERYQCLRVIQSNDISSVLLVQDQQTSKEYIQKILYKPADPLRLHQFRVEVDVLSTLRYDYCPCLVEVFEDEQRYVLVESKVPGIRFDQWLKLKKRWIGWKIQCVSMMIDFLNHVHDLGYLYIDFKTQNILIHEKRLYFTDFNACVPLNANTTLLASASNFFDSRPSIQTDIYALATVICQLSFHGPSRFIIKKALRKDPRHRYKSLKQFSSRFTLFHFGIYIMLLVSVLISSVFFFYFYQHEDQFEQYMHEKDPAKLIYAFSSEVSKSNDAKAVAIQHTFYEWIEKDAFTDKSFDDASNVRFLLLQALQSENGAYVDYVCKQIDETMLADMPDVYFLVSAYDQDVDLSYEMVKEVLIYIDHQPWTKSQIIDSLHVLLDTLLLKRIILLELERNQLNRMISSVLDDESSFDLAFVCLEYYLLLVTQNQSDLVLPQGMDQERFLENASYFQLMELWKEVMK